MARSPMTLLDNVRSNGRSRRNVFVTTKTTTDDSDLGTVVISGGLGEQILKFVGDNALTSKEVVRQPKA